MTFNFTIFLCFSNIRNHLSNFSYLACISCKIFIRWRFYSFLKTENSRRVAESRAVCVDLNGVREKVSQPKYSRYWCKKGFKHVLTRICEAKFFCTLI
jgi:hypothetical protein